MRLRRLEIEWVIGNTEAVNVRFLFVIESDSIYYFGKCLPLTLEYVNFTHVLYCNVSFHKVSIPGLMILCLFYVSVARNIEMGWSLAVIKYHSPVLREHYR